MYSVTSSAHRVPVYSINRSIPATANRLKLLEEHGEPIVPITHPAEFALESEDDYANAMRIKGPREPVE
jgi:sulfite oxidase